MKTYVVFTDGYQEASNMIEALKITKQSENVNYIVEIDWDNITDVDDLDGPEDLIYATESDTIKRTYIQPHFKVD